MSNDYIDDEATDYFHVPIIRDGLPTPDCELPVQGDPREWMRAYIRRQIEWSYKNFGHGHRTTAILNHIEKEIKEIVENPHDLEEWIDIIILALDGAWRCGRQRDYTPEDIMDMLDFKQLKNFDRVWVLPADPNQPCEHQREEERESNP
jgi:hypothetical protein